MFQLLLIASATFVSEDLTCIATGILIAAGKLGFVPGALACVLGIYVGDLLLYFGGRFVGRPIVRWRPMRKVLTEAKLDRASKWLSERGARVVIASRFTPGLRLPTYVAAGILKTRFWTFAGYFFLAALVWTPLLVGAAALFGERVRHSGYAVLGVVLGGALLLRRERQAVGRRAIGWFRRKTRWEFWPPWLAYLPVIPYLIYLGFKHRSLTLFTAANPGIPSGGFAGESKSRILAKLRAAPDFTVISKALPAAARCDAAEEFLRGRQLSYPVVLKPDAGERGRDVVIARNMRELRSYLESATQNVIVQRYVAGLEFGIFYYRYPGEAQGRICSITRKLFPAVTGDGRSTIAELVWNDERAVCLADLYLARLRRAPDEVPAAGEEVPLAEIGSHCRGAIFLDGATLETEALRTAVDAAAQSHPGFFFGRFDVRSPSIEALQAGRFEVLELNGVSSEATHIYDPAVSLAEAYRVMFSQWRMAFEIGSRNRRLGCEPLRLGEFVRLVWSRGKPDSRDQRSKRGRRVLSGLSDLSGPCIPEL